MNTTTSAAVPIAPSPRPTRAVQRATLARQAAAHLTCIDARLGRLIKRIGPHRPIIHPNIFVTLVGAIVQQQVSMLAAAAIRRRLVALCPRQRLTSEAVAALTPAALRGAGLSRQKTLYLLDLAEHFNSGKLIPRKLRRLPDEEVIAAVTEVKGVGRWTAEMLLIFCLERPDVWPIDDLGLRKAVRLFLNAAEIPGREALVAVAEPWRPYRSYATWYLWRSLEGPLMPGMSA